MRVLDAFGQVVRMTETPKVTGGDVSVAYAGPTLSPGYYQFRVVSVKANAGGRCPISTTEDLRGVFQIP